MESFSEEFLDHAMSPRNRGWIDQADAFGRAGAADRPPSLAMCFRIEGNVVRDVRFTARGCGLTIAAGSALSEIVLNRPIAECLAIKQETIIHALGGLPPEKRWCATFALTAMRRALEKYIEAKAQDEQATSSDKAILDT